ncbi:Carbohydrate binding module (family 6) [Actinacidiphila yanglinensis]|uniref:Carbohydrate binding module (Family 6) n=1 Tax=Actinacidiphila yanglinensis TaxID=310779 RepID=A0A1H6DH47_9ACTN|nr:carbohydrate-binding protein [Actinacidiphila yanglinensis]SEG84579.1 Carbohydrate binding module (family 6) [Actinacidiphila yanglinensis]
MSNRSRPRSAVLAAAAVFLSLGFSALATSAQASAGPRTFYVAPSGSDVHAGTVHSPFKTIHQCSSVMSAGDRCLIESGTYHETVAPARSGTAAAPITYAAAPGAQVVVDGADPVNGWKAVTSRDLTSLEGGDPFLGGSDFATAVGTGQVYQAHVTINPGLSGNQVFLDGAQQTEAQWPYPGGDVSVPKLASAQSGTTDSLSDTALTQPAGFWTGAQLTAHNWFVSETGTVSDSQVGSITAAGLPTCVGLSPNQSTDYSLKGKIELLGRPGEWFYQTSSHTLYLYSPDGSKPSAGSVEAKQRAVAIDLTGRSHISVLGLGIRGATARTSSTSTGDVLDGLVAHDISADAQLDPDPNMVTAPDGCAVLTAGETTSGILLKGHGNVIRNSLIDGSTGNGVAMFDSGNTVTNTTILHVDTLGSYAAGINVLGADQSITHNTIEGSGRSDINIDNKVAGASAPGHTIAYNDLSDYDNLVVDGGAVYVCCSVNMATTVIHHNQFHDPSPFAHTAPAPGVYLDNSTYNATVYDNVAWNRTTYGAVLINPNGQSTSGNRIYNNTSGTDTNVASTFGGTYSDTDIVNNIGVTGTDPGITNSNNFTPVSAAHFTNPAADDFTLTADSPARNAGVVWSPATDGSTDPQPSLGAYQYGAPKWVAGAGRVGQKVEAESYTSGSGVSTHAAGTGTVVGSFDGGDWIGYDNVDFGTRANLFTAFAGVDDSYADEGIEIHLDSVTGPLIGVLSVAGTGGFDTLSVQSTSITPTSGHHSVFLVAPGGQPGFGNIDYFSFSHAGQKPQ